MKTVKRLNLFLLFSFILSFSVSCGSVGTSNDQGTSFLALGYFSDSGGSEGQLGALVPLFFDVSSQGNLIGFDGNTVTTFIGLQNLLSRQFVRMTRVDCEYDLPGALVPIPGDSQVFSFILGPANPGPMQIVPTSSSTAFLEFEILSPDIIAYLNNNMNFLPQLPFRMFANCSAVGVSQAGDVFETNQVSFFLQFVDFEECCAGDPDFQVGPGTGGTPDSGT